MYLGRPLGGMAYADDLLRDRPERVIVWPAATQERFDLDACLAATAPETTVFCRGPERLIQAVEGGCERHALQFRAGRFAPAMFERQEIRASEIELSNSGIVLAVGADETILSILGLRACSSSPPGTRGRTALVRLEFSREVFFIATAF